MNSRDTFIHIVQTSRRLWLLLFLSWAGLEVMGQERSDSLAELPAVEILGYKQTSEPLSKTTWRSSEVVRLPARNASELLRTASAGYIKGYGMGSLATSSVRGGSAAQLLVLWNGIPIHSPMLGLLDLSMMPADLFDEVSLAEGGQSAAHGTGAVAGMLSMSHDVRFEPSWGVHLQSELGQFGHLRQQLQANVSGSKWTSSTRLHYMEGQNDFPYRAAPSLPETRQQHAHLITRDAMQTLGLAINEKNHIEAHAWYQSVDRQIPPTLVQNRSEAYQEDRALRTQIRYRHSMKRGELSIQNAYIHEELNYYDPMILLESPSNFTSYWLRSSLDQQYGRHVLQVGVDYTRDIAENSGYQASRPEETRIAGRVAWHYRSSKWHLRGQIRQTLVDDDWIDPAATFHVQYQAADGLTLEAKSSYDYRLPTLNDRFWRPGGNPDLLPEFSWSHEASARYQRQLETGSLNLQVTGFHRHTENWILWHPDSSSFFWTPQNIAEVRTRGIQWRLEHAYHNKDLTIRTAIGHTYLKSTNEQDVAGVSIEEGEQLLYTPEQRWTGSLSIDYGRWSVRYIHEYNGAVQGTQSRISAFDIGHLRLDRQLPLGTMDVRFFFDLQNVWNEDYIAIERRPMPGRHYRVGVRYGISSN